MVNKTTIQVNKETLQKLKLLRLTNRDSYNEIIVRMIEALKQNKGLIKNY